MNLNIYWARIKNRFRELWEYKIFRIAIIWHLIYFLLSIVLTLNFFRYQTDFRVYFMAGEVFLHDINDLYTFDFTCPFRYLPISAALFVPFFLMGFDLGFIVFNIFNLILNIFICLILYKIIILIRKEDHEKDNKKVIFYICIFLIGLPQLYNYVLGQINLYITFLLLVSLYLFLVHKDLKWDLFSSVILGTSIIIKPSLFLLIPFLMVFQIDFKKRKINFDFFRGLIRIIGVLAPAFFNFIFFFLYPPLLKGFLDTNFAGDNPIAQSFSFSISQLITNFYYFYSIPFNQIFILVGVIGIIGGFGFLIFIFRRFEDNSIIFSYAIGILIMLLAYFDSWDHHLLNLIPILIIIIFNLPKHSKIKGTITYSLFFFSFFSLIFSGIWMQTFQVFPYNFVPTLFLLITFYGISKYGVLKEKQIDMES